MTQRSPLTFSDLSDEMIKTIISYIPDLHDFLKIGELSKRHRKIILDMINQPKIVLQLLCALPEPKLSQYLNAYRKTKSFQSLQQQMISKTGEISDEVVLCHSLAVDKASEIDGIQLKKAIENLRAGKVNLDKKLCEQILVHLGLRVNDAIVNNNKERLTFLIQKGLPVDLRIGPNHTLDSTAATPLFIAVNRGNAAIAKILLDAGADPTLTYTNQGYTILHYAVRSNLPSVVNVLLQQTQYQLDVNAEDILGERPIDSAKNPQIMTALLNAGAISRISQDQMSFITNYNLIANELKKIGINLELLSTKGTCSGLSKLYIFYAKQNRRDEFKFFNSFINKLSPDDIQKLVQRYHREKNFLIGDSSTNSAYPVSKLFEFIKSVDQAQKTQAKTNFKSIKANWDATHLLAFSKNNLEKQFNDFFEKCGLMQFAPDESEKYMLISTAGHMIAMYITKQGVYYYDPNNANGEILCENIAQLIKQFNKFYLSLAPRELFAFSFIELSYGDQHRELDDALAECFADETLKFKYPKITYLIDQYHKGLISRADFAYTLQEELKPLVDSEIAFKQLLPHIPQFQTIDLIPMSEEQINLKVDSFEGTLLMRAAHYGSLKLLRQLLDAGADVNLQNDICQTAVWYAVQSGHLAILEELIQKNSDLDLNESPGKVGPLSLAIDRKDAVMTKVLVAAGADVSNNHNWMITPLCRAAKLGRDDLIIILAASPSANLNDTDQRTGTTPLCEAASQGHTKTVETLLEIGADINLRDKVGWTACALAVDKGKIETAKLLMTAGADINITVEGWTPLAMAIDNGNLAMVKLLLDAGADVDLANDNGLKPIEIAERRRLDAMAKLLKAHQTANKVMTETQIRLPQNQDLIAIKISKLFSSYANPPLLSFSRPKHRELANSIADHLKKMSHLDGKQCKEYLNHVITDYQSHAQKAGTKTIKDTHVLKVLIDKVDQLLDAQNNPSNKPKVT